MTKNRSFPKITEILQKKLRSVIVSQNHFLNKILDVHPLSDKAVHRTAPATLGLLNSGLSSHGGYLQSKSFWTFSVNIIH